MKNCILKKCGIIRILNKDEVKYVENYTIQQNSKYKWIF